MKQASHKITNTAQFHPDDLSKVFKPLEAGCDMGLPGVGRSGKWGLVRGLQGSMQNEEAIEMCCITLC